MDNHLKRRVAQCSSEDNTSLEANEVVVVAEIQELESVESAQAVGLLRCAYIMLLRICKM